MVSLCILAAKIGQIIETSKKKKHFFYADWSLVAWRGGVMMRSRTGGDGRAHDHGGGHGRDGLHDDVRVP